jgi:hypothetical protein
MTTKSYSETLIEKATYGCIPLTPAELEALWEIATNALHNGPYHVAFAGTEALLVQADKGNVGRDTLPDVRFTKCAEGRTLPMIQGFIDRIESYNWKVTRKSRCTH